jgi:hypothetical protein
VPGFPVHDWQFWLVTALALGAAAWLLRGVLPIGSRRRRARRGQRRATLTVDGRAVSTKRGGS